MSTAARAARKRKAAAGHKQLPVFPIVVGGLAVLFVVAIVLSMGGDDSGGTAGGANQQTAAVDITGESLPEMTRGGNDPAVGMQIPEVSGEDFSGRPLTIAADGTPKMIVFMAHWCSHCQAEVPVIQDWLDAGNGPEGVEMVTVNTLVDRGQPNYPPSEWLDREGWSMPTLLDDEGSSVSDAFGLPGTPYFVFVNGDGTVASRTSGEIPIDALEQHLAAIVP
jgi:thiol-disulfide isomerase/thioredoxin